MSDEDTVGDRSESLTVSVFSNPRDELDGDHLEDLIESNDDDCDCQGELFSSRNIILVELTNGWLLIFWFVGRCVKVNVLVLLVWLNTVLCLNLAEALKHIGVMGFLWWICSFKSVLLDKFSHCIDLKLFLIEKRRFYFVLRDFTIW